MTHRDPQARQPLGARAGRRRQQVLRPACARTARSPAATWSPSAWTPCARSSPTAPRSASRRSSRTSSTRSTARTSPGSAARTRSSSRLAR
nr:hypothetical protein [Angustibacter aerolatus]